MGSRGDVEADQEMGSIHHPFPQDFTLTPVRSDRDRDQPPEEEQQDVTEARSTGVSPQSPPELHPHHDGYSPPTTHTFLSFHPELKDGPSQSRRSDTVYPQRDGEMSSFKHLLLR